MRLTAAAATVVSAVAVAGIVAGPAAADVPDHELVFETSSPSSSATSATAHCPPGKDLIGVGASTLGSPGHVFVRSIVPDLVADSVEVQADEDLAGTTGNWQVRATAVCADAGAIPGLYLAEGYDAPNGASPDAGAFADCDPGDRTLSAGFEFSGATRRLHLTTLLPTEDSVLAVAQEDAAGTTAPWGVRAIAICAPVYTGYLHLADNASLTSSGTHMTATFCPPGHSVTGVGGTIYDEAGDTGSLALSSMTPIEYAGAHYSHITSLEASPGTTADSTLYTYAVCVNLP